MLGRWYACAICRGKKRRCDGARPMCRPCISSGAICRYEEKKRSRVLTSEINPLTRLDGLEAKLGSISINHTNTPELLETNQIRHSITRSSTIPRLHTKNTLPLQSHLQVYTEYPDAAHDRILAIFFQYQHCTISSIDQQKFLSALNSEDRALRPHPALIDAAILTGILFAELLSQTYLLPPSTPDPETLVSRVHRELASSLGMADRLLDYLQASNLLCFWYFCRGRLQEGKYLSSSSFRLAIDCHLHQLDAHILEESQAIVQSSFWDRRPRDSYETNLRVMTFWQCYHWDVKLSLITGLPSASNESITTVWPKFLLDHDPEVGIDPDRLKSVKGLLAGELRSTSDVLSYGHIVAWMYLGCKAVELSLRARASYSQDKSEQSESDLEAVRSLASATHQFATICKIRNPDKPCHPNLPWGKSTPSAYLLVLLTFYVTHIELIRAAESLSRPKDLTGTTGRSQDADFYDILGPLTLQKNDSIQDAKFAIAKTSIEVAHTIIVEHAHHWVDNQRSSPAVMITQIPNFSGFLLTTPMLVAVEYVRSLKARLACPFGDASSPSLAEVIARIKDGEAVLGMGRIVMSLLCVKLPILRFQIEKIEQALKAPPIEAVTGVTP